MHKYAIIVAGGIGSRMGGDLPKQFMLLNGKPVLWHTLKAFTEAYDDIQIILVLPAGHLEKGEEFAKEFPGHRIRITSGGETRFHSVKNGLSLVDAHAIVFVHDAVRCLVSPQLIRRCAEAALQNDNAIPSIASVDTVRIVTSKGNETVNRENIRIIQTPQTFFSNVIKQAYELPYQESFTDEASVVEKTGIAINLIEGEVSNIKITQPADLFIAAMLLDKKNGG